MQKQKAQFFTWIYTLAFLAVVAALMAGIYLLREPNPPMGILLTGAAFLCSGYLGLISILVTLPMAMNSLASHKVLLKSQEELFRTLGDRLQGISVLMNLISEQQLLSDRAKTVAFREKDHEAVARAVNEEMAHGNWEAARRLADDLETYFGYKQEADRYRGEIESRRTETHRRALAEYMAPIDRHVKAEAWGTALQEAQQLMEKFPEDAHVRRLPDEIESRRQMRKQQLRDSWQDAVNRHDVDGSIDILKKLDLYLTPAEAESMQEIARNVFKEKREALRMRFSQAVKEQRLAEALRLGEEIMTDFPNTRMAQEVREMMEPLRQRMTPVETNA
jgi:hypothetical protein